MKKLVEKVAKIFGYNIKKEWKDIEYFNPNWKNRIKNMSKFVTSELSIMDLGCGKMWLKEFISPNIKYIPVDYTIRGEGTIVCDFNNYEYPSVYTEIAFVSGCLEYVNDYEWIIKKICGHHKKCILSYCTTEFFPDIKERIEKTWVNNLSERDIIYLFKHHGFKLIEKELALNTIFVFEK